MASITEPRGEGGGAPTGLFGANVRRALAYLVRREEDKCHPQPNVDLCEKPAISSTSVTWIIVGVCIGLLVVGLSAVLIFLHFRRKKRDKREDMDDRFESSDYGLDEMPASRKPRPDDSMKLHEGSPHGYGRRSRDPLQVGTEPKLQPGQLDGHLNPFDDASSFASGQGTSKPPSANPAWPKRESSQQSPPSQDK
ncbi:hypothetical protein N658DRAFT_517565 [Parathielavia hyrcaniae]|uniref:Uncharacterized protein n=1 Tax=Parathielavia hyrcaniae TaxID=113614 RepID=A0AAN6PW97_9PEZI|nr:hypothetical protein N658DRAFT_517565 [Parathielavia hyrcaniae]